jgi:hypothetical protein
MRGNVFMSFFTSLILSNVIKIISSHNNSSVHLGGDDHSLDNSSSDGNVACERALLVYEMTANGVSGSVQA